LCSGSGVTEEERKRHVTIYTRGISREAIGEEADRSIQSGYDSNGARDAERTVGRAAGRSLSESHRTDRNSDSLEDETHSVEMFAGDDGE
jgi:hypothetical protein